MHRQIWAPPHPLGRQHASATLAAGTGWAGPQDDGHGTMLPAHPRGHDAELGVRTQQPHSLPCTHKSSQPARSSSVATAAGCSLLQDGTPASPGGGVWTQAGAWGSLNSRKGPLNTPRVGCEQGCVGLSLLFPPAREELTADSRPAPSLGARGCHYLGFSIPTLPETEGGSQLTPNSMPLPAGFLPAARSPAQRHSRAGTAAGRLRSKQAVTALPRPGPL